MEWNQVVLKECAEDFDILSIHHYSDPDGYYTAALAQDSLYKKLRQAIASCAKPSIKIYVSEWNAQSTDWRTGMYAGNLLNIFEQNSDVVTIGGPALFLRHVTASAWDNAFINFDQSGWFQQEFSVRLPGDYSASGARGYLVKGLSLTDRNTMEKPDQIKPVSHTVTIKGKKLYTKLPELSCLLIEVK